MGEIFNKEIINEDNQEYFGLINRKFHNELENNSNNNRKKYWKNVIINYLEKQNKIGIDWCLELINLIKRTKFINEKKFIDLFNWQKFEIKTKPNCLNNKDSNLKIKNKINNFTFSLKSSLSDKEYELNKEKRKQYIKIFEEHLNDKEHPISICIELFIQVFIKEIVYHLNDVQQIKDINEKINKTKIIFEAIQQQLIFFLFKIQKCFAYMYSNVIPYNFFNEEKNDLTIIFSSKFFSNKKLYYLIFELRKIINENEIKNFQNHIQNLKKGNIHPKNININDKFTLDNYTEKLQMNFIIKNDLNITDNILIYLNTHYKENNYLSYQSSMDLFKTIKNYNTPFDKIKLLYSLGKNIIEDIMKIWNPIEKFLPKNYLSIDGDELILIFSYIIIYSDINDLLAHLFFIKNFTTQETKNSMIGYYYTIIEASIIKINDLDEKDYGFEQYEIYNNILNFKNYEKQEDFNDEINTSVITKETI